ncbi:serine/threonine protein kinase [Nonomuraea fuscirosea]|uniref:serine/threonine protein kinase n=1 Tax=Nonomuraea fuscirosea TaxID=1291556 RepID=UPI002DD7EF80|nr:serine/threonine-protein kinase [Nonomuraea fuscirosea]WSA53451.1 serine/threonine protein kinase [Nonomuraea fuscirosea]
MANVEPLREDDPPAAGPYRLLGRLGAGGQGTVYLGQAPDGRRVAVKVLRGGAGFGARFAKEIEAARRVEPFCIAQVLDASPDDRQPYIVTEYVEGPSLQQAGRHTGADLQRLAVATATALAAIHQAGVVHRDFKPANVLLGPGGPRVIDFGIARAMDDPVTHSGAIVGTLSYMAPEQLAGEPLGPAADVFAWASVMVWAGTGAPPFGQDTMPAIINRILHNEPHLGELPHGLRAIVYDCLAKDPRRRPTMRDVILRLLSGQNPGPPPQPGPGAASGDWAQHTPPPRPPSTGSQDAGSQGAGFQDAGPQGAGPGPLGPGQGPPMGPGVGPGHAPGPGPGHRGRRPGSALVAVAGGVGGVLVAALVAGVVWAAPWSGWKGAAFLSAGSPTPDATSDADQDSDPDSDPDDTADRTAEPGHKPTKTTSKPRTTAPKTQKPTQKPTSTPTSTPTRTRTPARTSARPTPAPTRTTRKPATSARISILQIGLSGGPGQSGASGCYMPPVHFQTQVESSRPGIWISYKWAIDGRVRVNNRSWVSEGEYTAFVTSGQYMLDAGRHTITLNVTAPAATSKSITIDVCSMDDYQ